MSTRLMTIRGLTTPFRPLALLGLLALLLTLGACSQRPSPQSGTTDDMTIQILAVPSDLTVTLQLDGGALQPVDVDASGNASVTLTNVSAGPHTLTARGTDAGGIVLYKGATGFTAPGTSTVNMVMNRLTSQVGVTVTNVSSASNVVVATVGGVQQALTVSGATASGTVVGVATGGAVPLFIEELSGTLERVATGGATLALSEAPGNASVALTLLGPGEERPAISFTATPAAQIDEGDTFSLAVRAVDANSDVSSLTVAWGDGKTETFNVNPASGSVSHTFTHVYDPAGTDTTFNYSVSAGDAVGGGAPATGTVTVIATPVVVDDSVEVVIDKGKELSKVTLEATGVPAGASSVQVSIDGTATVSLFPQGAGKWGASLMMSQSTTYSLVYTAGSATSAPVSCVVPAASAHTCTHAFGTGNGGGTPPAALKANDDTATAYTAGDGRVVLIDVLANDSDKAATIASVTQPADATGSLGSTKIVGNKIEYTAPNFNSGPNETFNFSYTISKGSSTATATVRVTVLVGIAR